MSSDVAGTGTPADPWQLRTPPGSSEYTACRDAAPIRPRSSCRSARRSCATTSAASRTCTRCSKAHGDWMPLGGADEQKPAAEGTVEAWGRSDDNPVGGLVRHQEGPARPLRELRAAGARGARPGRGRAQGAQQPHARALIAPQRPSARTPREPRSTNASARGRGSWCSISSSSTSEIPSMAVSVAKPRSISAVSQPGSRSVSLERYSICSQRSPVAASATRTRPKRSSVAQLETAQLVFGQGRRVEIRAPSPRGGGPAIARLVENAAGGRPVHRVAHVHARGERGDPERRSGERRTDGARVQARVTQVRTRVHAGHDEVGRIAERSQARRHHRETGRAGDRIARTASGAPGTEAGIVSMC